MPAPELDIQQEWTPDHLARGWRDRFHTAFMLECGAAAVTEAVVHEASGRVLEVGAADATHSVRFATHGLGAVVLEPSTAMLERARGRGAEHGVRLQLVRGIGERLPFADDTFERVVCDSALDHFASPDQGVREMVRVLAPEGRLVISFVNYAGLAARVSRGWDGLARTMRGAMRDRARPWDSPVGYDHTFECTYRNVLELCGQHLELHRATGVSLLWNTPGSSAVLEALPHDRHRVRVLHVLDRIAYRVPALADFVVTTWRRRGDGEPPGIGLHLQSTARRLLAPTLRPPPPRLLAMRSTPADPIYRRRRDDAHGERPWRDVPDIDAQAEKEYQGTLTGMPGRSWLDDLIDRGPFPRGLLLGDHPAAERWLRVPGNDVLDVVDSSARRLARLGLALAPLAQRARRVCADPNFVRLPRARYDVVWSSNGFDRVVNLEYLLDEIADSLRSGGLLTYFGWVGERRLQFGRARLALINAALAEVPARFRRNGVDRIEVPPLDHPWASGAMRSDEIVPLAKARFDVVHEGRAGALAPLLCHLDLAALARDAPEVLARLRAREAEARRDPTIEPCIAYLVLRRRS